MAGGEELPLAWARIAIPDIPLLLTALAVTSSSSKVWGIGWFAVSSLRSFGYLNCLLSSFLVPYHYLRRRFVGDLSATPLLIGFSSFRVGPGLFWSASPVFKFIFKSISYYYVYVTYKLSFAGGFEPCLEVCEAFIEVKV